MESLLGAVWWAGGAVILDGCCMACAFPVPSSPLLLLQARYEREQAAYKAQAGAAKEEAAAGEED